MKKGFTLIELLVVLGIMSVIMGTVLYDHSKFDSEIELTNTAYRLALEIRQAQVYGISVRQAADNNFTAPYGIHYTPNSNNSLILYADTGGNALKYDWGGSAGQDGDYNCVGISGGGECVEKLILSRGNTISKVCPIANQGETDCAVLGSNLIALDIMFKRPNPDALFYSYTGAHYDNPSGQLFNACGSGSNNTCHGWAFCISAPQGTKKQVVVYDTGQISVELANNLCN